MTDHDHAPSARSGAARRAASTLDLCAEGRHAFVLVFPDSDQIAVVRTHDPLGAVEAAWACGCNPGGTVGEVEVPVADIEEHGLPSFTLLGPPLSTPWTAEYATSATCPGCGRPHHDSRCNQAHP